MRRATCRTSRISRRVFHVSRHVPHTLHLSHRVSRPQVAGDPLALGRVAPVRVVRTVELVAARRSERYRPGCRARAGGINRGALACARASQKSMPLPPRPDLAVATEGERCERGDGREGGGRRVGGVRRACRRAVEPVLVAPEQSEADAGAAVSGECGSSEGMRELRSV